MTETSKQHVQSCSWGLSTDVDVAIYGSELDDIDFAMSFISNATCFEINLNLADAMEIRDGLNRAIEDLFRGDDTIQCPACGYTWEDAKHHADHKLCRSYPFFPGETGKSQAVNIG